MNKPTFKTKKSEQTFERVLASACDLFVERGYERTTMRDISKAGGLGLGALYYYFGSKEEVMQHFYERINARVAAEFRSGPTGADAAQGFALLMQIKLRALEPHRHLLRVILKEAVDPESPLCPLSEASQQTLDVSLGVFEEIATWGGQAEPGTDECRQMARGLWFLHMGLLGYWLHDRSEGFTATAKAVETAVQVLTWSRRLSRIPGYSPLRKRVLSLTTGLLGQRAQERTAVPNEPGALGRPERLRSNRWG